MRFTGFLYSSLLIFSSTCLAQAPKPVKTPDSIEKMFSDELNSVRGVTGKENEREHRALIDALIDRLEIGDINQRYEATVLLQKEVAKSDISVIVEALRKNEAVPEIHIPLIGALGAIKDPAVMEPLRDEFNQGNIDAQLAVIDALVDIPDEKIVNMLADIISSGDNSQIHVRAAAGLGKIGGERALYALNSVTDRIKSGPAKAAILWAIKYANGEISPKRIDNDIEEGRQQVYYYKGMTYYAFRPAFRMDAPKSSWALVCIHGSELNFEQTIDLCQPIAKQFKMTLLVPFFDPVNFPEYETFNLRGIRSDKRLIELLDHLGEKAEVRTKEFYMIGLGDGGDFAQRFAFFYPDRIARAAFTTTFFYPMEVKQYFPIGLKSTPLAPDLKVDFPRIIKTDFSYILDPYQGGQKEYKIFQSQMQEYVLKSQHVPRIRYRELTEKNNTIEGVLKVAKDYLFPPIND